MKTILVSTLGLASALSMAALPAQRAPAAEPTACVPLAQIDHTHVVDDQQILFYMRNDDIYLNRLSHRALGLDLRQPFMYRTSTSRLCENDMITVLEDGGFGLRPGASSGLGRFVPIDEARAKSLESGEAPSAEVVPLETD